MIKDSNLSRVCEINVVNMQALSPSFFISNYEPCQISRLPLFLSCSYTLLLFVHALFVFLLLQWHAICSPTSHHFDPNVISALTSVILHHHSIISPTDLLNILELGYNLWLEFKSDMWSMRINSRYLTTLITFASSPVNPVPNHMCLSVIKCIIFWTYAHLSAKNACLSPQALRIIFPNSSCSIFSSLLSPLQSIECTFCAFTVHWT